MRFLCNCGYDGVRLHDLGETAATILTSKGVPIKNVQAYLGHKDVQTTLNYYAFRLAAKVVMDVMTEGQMSE